MFHCAKNPHTDRLYLPTKWNNKNLKDMKNQSTIALFTFLSKKLQYSGLKVLSRIDGQNFIYDASDTDMEDDRRPRRKRTMEYSDGQIDEIIEQIDDFAEYLNLTTLETVALVALFTIQIEDNDRSDIDALCRFFDTPLMDLLPLKAIIPRLYDKGYFKQKYESRGRFRRMCSRMDPVLEDAILNNKPFAISPKEEIDRYKFCIAITELANKRQDEDMPTDSFLNEMTSMEEEHKDLKFVQNTIKKLKEPESRALFYIICCCHISSENTNIEDLVETIYDDHSKRYFVASKFMNDTHPLIKKCLVEKKPATFFSRTSLTLLNDGKRLLFEKDYDTVCDRDIDDGSIIKPEKIDKKQLFFSDELTEKVLFLQNSLEEKRLKTIRARLKEKSMPQGMTAIFYGLPGTGKTETAMQLAKATGRKVMHVDISKAKTCWYGESQKLVKRIFINYAEKCRTEKLKPILLFNEADALFGKRSENVNHSTEQTDNAIQNIILEEMEKLDGIMIATTNLSNNLDDAFERRFLFKIKFDKPTIEAKRNIWKSKLPALSDDDCDRLATKFDYTGGEIDNVVRKFTMKEILEDAQADYQTIANLCMDEKLNKQTRPTVGY